MPFICNDGVADFVENINVKRIAGVRNTVFDCAVIGSHDGSCRHVLYIHIYIQINLFAAATMIITDANSAPQCYCYDCGNAASWLGVDSSGDISTRVTTIPPPQTGPPTHESVSRTIVNLELFLQQIFLQNKSQSSAIYTEQVRANI